MRTCDWIVLAVTAALGAASCADDDADPDLGGGIQVAGSGGTGAIAGTGGASAGRGGTGGTTVTCGACDVPIHIYVTGSDGRLNRFEWTARIRGNGLDCTTTADHAGCLYSVTPGEYRVDVTSDCTRWSERVRVGEGTPGAACDCGYITAVLQLQEPAQCDAEAGDTDAGADDADSDDAGR